MQLLSHVTTRSSVCATHLSNPTLFSCYTVMYDYDMMLDNRNQEMEAGQTPAIASSQDQNPPRTYHLDAIYWPGHKKAVALELERPPVSGFPVNGLTKVPEELSIVCHAATSPKTESGPGGRECQDAESRIVTSSPQRKCLRICMHTLSI